MVSLVVLAHVAVRRVRLWQRLVVLVAESTLGLPVLVLESLAHGWEAVRRRALHRDADGGVQMLDPSGGVAAGGSGTPPSLGVVGHAEPSTYAVIDNDP